MYMYYDNNFVCKVISVMSWTFCFSCLDCVMEPAIEKQPELMMWIVDFGYGCQGLGVHRSFIS